MSLSITTGDLLDQQVDAIVNAWNRNIIPWWLLVPQGVSGAIKRRGGTEPFRELGYRPMPLGTARHTGAGRLHYRGIIHVAAIDMLWRASEKSITDATRAACELARALGYRSLAMPVLGSGSGGYAVDAALALMERSATAYTDDVDIRIVKWGGSSCRAGTSQQRQGQPESPDVDRGCASQLALAASCAGTEGNRSARQGVVLQPCGTPWRNR